MTTTMTTTTTNTATNNNNTVVDTTLARAIGECITRMKKRGTIGASLENLRQCVHTDGLLCTVAKYRERFPLVAASVAARRGFELS